MLVTAFSEELAQHAIRKARSLRFWKIFLRLLFIILKTKGYSNTAITDILLVSRKTIMLWQGMLQHGVFEVLSKRNTGSKKSPARIVRCPRFVRSCSG